MSKKNIPLSGEKIYDFFSPEEIESVHRDLLEPIVAYMDKHRCSAKEAYSQCSIDVVTSTYLYRFAYNKNGVLECFHHEKHEKVG